MKTKVHPEDYILSVLSPEERLEAALKLAKTAFKKTALRLKDVERAVEKVRRRAYEETKG
ncbi:MAG TPA: hypothetical protein ACFYD2_08495 [Candidatus Avalokitesvara rifleensis]|uniref:hypothetical protein n=1 Tax=Candidatus Avalokitesvara rifleensis TaxID=3367620 RepID=UPI0040288587